jgi:hypothetical protein
LKLKCDEPLSNAAFNFNVRRYTTASAGQGEVTVGAMPMVGRCRLKRVETDIERTWFQRLKLQYA